MGLITEPGYRFANSYCTVAEASIILATMPDAITAWTALTTAEKEFRLEMAASFMSDLSFRGYKAYQYQALAFPRKDCQENLGWTLAEVPYDVKRAQAYIAYAVVHRALAGRVAITEDTETKDVKSFSVGGLSITFGEGSAGSDVEAFLEDQHFPIYMLLKRFLIGIRHIVGADRIYEPPVSTTTATTTSSTSTTSTSSISTSTSTTST